MMGVWHVSGLGLNPGAITVPLNYVYLTLKAAAKNNKQAKRFFDFSGEITQKLKGAPEYLIIFTSKEVITGKKGNKDWDVWNNIKIDDNWFNTRKKRDIPSTIISYLSNLLTNLQDKDFDKFYNGDWLKGIYFLEVNHEDFDDCFFKIGVTLNALKDKEVWTNMIGGTNQINIALFTTSSFSAISARYYYVFQLNLSLLHPEVKKPNMNNPIDFLKHLDKWHEIPIFHLGSGPILKGLNEKFQWGDKVNISMIEKLLEENDYPKKFITKLRGKIIKIDGDVCSPGYLLDTLSNMIQQIDAEDIKNTSEWINWGKEKNILHEFKFE
jgi:hypothetical protein